jgi:hypothetical protein
MHLIEFHQAKISGKHFFYSYDVGDAYVVDRSHNTMAKTPMIHNQSAGAAGKKQKSIAMGFEPTIFRAEI